MTAEIATQELKVSLTPAKIVANIEEMQTRLKARLKPYEGLVLAADQIQEGKKLIATLNKEKRSITEARRRVMNDHKSTALPFENGMKSLEDMYDHATADMKKQVEESEAKRKQVVHDVLQQWLVKELDEAGVADEFRRATVSDLVSLTALTSKDKPTAKVYSELRSRVAEDRGLQDRTEMRLLKLENESWKAGLHAPLTRDHVRSFLFEDDGTYSNELDRVIAAEIQRQKATEERIAKRNAEVAEQQKTAVLKENEEPDVQQPSQAAYIPRTTPASSTPENISAPEVVVTCTFHPTVPAGVSDEQLEAALRKQMEAAGFTSLHSIKITRNKNQEAA